MKVNRKLMISLGVALLVFGSYILTAYKSTLIILKNSTGKPLTNISVKIFDEVYKNLEFPESESKYLYLRNHQIQALNLSYCIEAECLNKNNIGYFIPGSLFTKYYVIEILNNKNLSLETKRFFKKNLKAIGKVQEKNNIGINGA